MNKKLRDEFKLQFENELEKETNENTKNKKWFDDETLKAKNGERFRYITKRTGKILGYETIHGPSYQYKDSEWNGGNTYWEHSSEQFPSNI